MRITATLVSRLRDDPQLAALQKTLEKIREKDVNFIPQLVTLQEALEDIRDDIIKPLEERHWLHSTIREHVAKMPDPLEEIEFIVNIWPRSTDEEDF
ncbi:hypothetical protein L218DRAFT_1010335 [Marasmius fiardii PR-910]|nr:hypothetical protein L218DRAFT_1010335 [Marasmius fiardii PR-910]